MSRLWEERRLCYPIAGHRKGTYWLTYFKLSADSILALRRRFQLTDTILRMLLLKVDAKSSIPWSPTPWPAPPPWPSTPRAERPVPRRPKKPRRCCPSWISTRRSRTSSRLGRYRRGGA